VDHVESGTEAAAGDKTGLAAIYGGSGGLAMPAIEYSFNLAEWIAREHACGASLATLHAQHSDRVPNPIIVKRWRREFPAFDLLMIEAEHARADCLVDETLGIADDTSRNAAAAGNAIRARQWLAERLNRKLYGRTVSVDVPADGGHGESDDESAYTDEELQAIIRAGLRASSIEGEAKRIADPGAPPAGISAGLEQNDGPDPSRPKIFSQKIPSEVPNDATEVEFSDVETTDVETTDVDDLF
jgi:hypothetical protein